MNVKVLVKVHWTTKGEMDGRSIASVMCNVYYRYTVGGAPPTSKGNVHQSKGTPDKKENVQQSKEFSLENNCMPINN